MLHLIELIPDYGVARYNGAPTLPLGLIEHFELQEVEKLETENTIARKGRNTGAKNRLEKIVPGQKEYVYLY